MSRPSWTCLPHPTPSHRSRLLQSPGCSSQSPTANFHWLSILHMVVCMLPCYSLCSSHCLLPTHPPPPQVCSLCLCLHCCPANRFISTAAAAAKSCPSCPTLCDPIDGSPTGSSLPGILQARTTGVGCHFLLQCMKVKSESEVTQSCPTLSYPMNCSLPGSSVHGIFQARVLEWGAIAFSVISTIFR